MQPRVPYRRTAAVLLMTIILVWYAYRRESDASANTEHGSTVAHSPSAAESRAKHSVTEILQPSTMPTQNTDHHRIDSNPYVPPIPLTERSISTPPQTIAIATDAAIELADAIHHGDERAPPIERTTDNTVAPTLGELADPVAYRRYQSHQQDQMYASFEQHALIALGDMQRDMQRARAEHLSPELIAEGEEKLQKLAQTLDLLRKHEVSPVRQ